jgi:hypothetical protein
VAQRHDLSHVKRPRGGLHLAQSIETIDVKRNLADDARRIGYVAALFKECNLVMLFRVRSEEGDPGFTGDSQRATIRQLQADELHVEVDHRIQVANSKANAAETQSRRCHPSFPSVSHL